MKPLPFILILFILFMTTQNLSAQETDTSDYRHISAEELCKMLAENPGKYVFVDVRSAEEHTNTHPEAWLNIGHLKDAINIPIATFEHHYTELDKYADKEIIVYCSHGRRSRVVSQFLVSKGYNNFYNLYGGLTKLKDSDIPCKDEIHVK